MFSVLKMIAPAIHHRYDHMFGSISRKRGFRLV